MLKRLLRNLTLVLIAGSSVVLASVPKSNEITNDRAIYQQLHEVRLTSVKASDLDAKIDSDFEKLSATEKRHRHRVVPLRVSAPMDRVMKVRYAPSMK